MFLKVDQNHIKTKQNKTKQKNTKNKKKTVLRVEEKPQTRCIFGQGRGVSIPKVLHFTMIFAYKRGKTFEMID